MALRSYLSSLPTPTAIHTSIQTLTRVLLLYTALQTDSSHLILGTSLTTLAVSLISGVAQGSGFNVREEMLEEWSPDPGITTVPELWPEDGKKTKKLKRTVRIVRPLRDIGMKECAAWAWWSRISVVGKEKWLWPGAKPGIGTLTKGASVSRLSLSLCLADQSHLCYSLTMQNSSWVSSKTTRQQCPRSYGPALNCNRRVTSTASVSYADGMSLLPSVPQTLR